MNTIISKSELRKQIEARRRALGETVRIEKSRQIIERVQTEFDWLSAKTVCIYVWFKNEVQTDALIQSAWDSEKIVCVPLCGKSEEDKITLYRIDSFDDLAPGAFGIREPSIKIQSDREKAVKLTDVDLFIIPGLAFDKQGNRLGWGGGYYDWTLSQAPRAKKIALAFECQMVDSLPTEPQDVKMDKVITEQL